MTDINKGCTITEWNINIRFVQEVKKEPTILVDVTGMTDAEIQELYNEVNKPTMPDIREQILQDFIKSKKRGGCYDIMDIYAIKILQWLHEHKINFKSTEPFEVKVFLEEIKTELNEETK